MIHNLIRSIQERRYGYQTVTDTEGILRTVNSFSGDLDLMAYETSNGLYSVTTDECVHSTKTKQVFITKEINWNVRLEHVSLARLRRSAEIVLGREQDTVKSKTPCAEIVLLVK